MIIPESRVTFFFWGGEGQGAHEIMRQKNKIMQNNCATKIPRAKTKMIYAKMKSKINSSQRIETQNHQPKTIKIHQILPTLLSLLYI